MFDEKIFMKGFRKDGWPYCPSCGEDELYLKSNHQLKCYLCAWDEDSPNKEIDKD
jgi:hypothetical protein